MSNIITDSQILNHIGIHLISQTKDGIVVVKPDGCIIYYNPAFASYFNLSESDLLGSNIRRALNEVQIFEIMRTNQNRINALGIIQCKGKHTSNAPSGSNVHIISRYSITDETGNTIAGVMVIQFQELLLECTKKLASPHHSFDFSRASDTSSQTEEPFAVIGTSKSFLKAKELALRAGRNDFPVLITGETGTGKEVIANIIHNSSARKHQPFIKINCASIPADLLESELFGYEPGAFTGASKTGKKGKFELANGGSIFLDEIGDMPLSMQVKLLRVLQEKVVEHIGGYRSIPINVRIISATRWNLLEMIEEQTFREDLFYRLNVIHVHLPSLQERKEDIIPLAEHFLKLLNQTYDSNIKLPASAHSLLNRRAWPGNIRELNNVIQSAYAITDTHELNLELISQNTKTVPDPLPDYENLNASISAYEKALIESALSTTNFNLAAAAAQLQIPRSSLYNKIKRHNISILRLR